jgi:diguanylate cyclase
MSAMETESERLLAIIATQSEIAGASLNSKEVMNLVARRAQELTGATAGVLEIPDGDEMVYTVTTGEATPYLGTRLGRDTSLSGMSLTQNAVLYSQDTETDDRVDQEACRRVNARSMICVPLRHDSEPVGVLKVYSPEARHFSEQDIETLRLISGSVSAQMAHASLYELEKKESRTDALTGLFNRRSYEERRTVESARSARSGKPLGLCLFDLNGFKAVNDRLGHPAGDEVLRGIAGVIDSSRLSDDAFRIGGDEFAVLMPDTSEDSVITAAERLSRAIVDAGLGDGNVSASFGISARVGDPLGLHDAADRSLLEAKAELGSARAAR